MKVLGLIGSPRKNSNTDLIVKQILEGAETNNYQTEKLYLYDLKIEPCLDCRTCKTAIHKCILTDDMQTVFLKLEEADAIVFGTPLYWYGPSGKMKLLLDRFRPYVASKKLSGKKGVLVVPSEEGAEACRFTLEMFMLTFKYLGMSFAGCVLPKAYEKAEVKTQPETLKVAFEMGKRLK